MSTKKITHEIKLSRPLMAVAVVATIGVLMIGLRPFIKIDNAWASSGVTKVAICNPHGSPCYLP